MADLSKKHALKNNLVSRPVSVVAPVDKAIGVVYVGPGLGKTPDPNFLGTGHRLIRTHTLFLRHLMTQLARGRKMHVVN